MAKKPAEKEPARSGPAALFRDKIRDKPITFTAIQQHHDSLTRNMKRVGVTRADLLALLIEKFADTVTIDMVTPD